MPLQMTEATVWVDEIDSAGTFFVSSTEEDGGEFLESTECPPGVQPDKHRRREAVLIHLARKRPDRRACRIGLDSQLTEDYRQDHGMAGYVYRVELRNQ